MSEILSQNEIDELLSALSAGEIKAEEIIHEENKKKIRVYDFKRPNKFSKEQLRTLNMIHENFARLLTTYLSAHLRTYVSVNVFSVEQMTYYEFIASLTNPSIIAISDFSPLKGSGIIEINPALALSIIDRMLGGPGRFNDDMRDLTDIEQVIMKRVFREILKILANAWENIVKLEPELLEIETNPQFVQLVSPNETVALITFNGKIGNTKGLINICFPHIVIEPILQKLSTRYWFSNTKKENDFKYFEKMELQIKRASLPIKVCLGKSTLTVKEILELQEGDVIQLNKKVKEEVDVVVGNKLKFKGYPGVFNKSMSVKITRLVEEEEG